MCLYFNLLRVASATVSGVDGAHFIGYLDVILLEMVLFGNHILIEYLYFIIKLARFTITSALVGFVCFTEFADWLGKYL
jgi:hypothetical protein